MKQIPVLSFLAALGRPILLRQRAHLRLRQMRQRKQGRGELRLGEAVEEIALVLVGVRRAQQRGAATGVRALADVMPGGDVFRAARDGVVEEGLELDLGVAQHVGVGGAAGLVFGEEVAEHAFLVFGGEVDRLDLDAEHVGHRQHVEKVLARSALLGIVVVVPVLHEDAEHVVALLFQQIGGDGGIDPARHADDNFSAHAWLTKSSGKRRPAR